MQEEHEKKDLLKIMVCVKRVIDPFVKIRVKSDLSGVETKGAKMAMNPFDEIALEEALRMRERSEASEIKALCIGSEACTETLRQALALGADSALLVQTDQLFESLNIAKIVRKIAEDSGVQLILMGKQSIDGDNNQTPQMLAALMQWPLASFASKIVRQNKGLEVTREVDGGLETVFVSLPAVVSVDLRLNVPRYPRLPDIMKSKSKPLDKISLDSLNLSLRARSQILNVRAPEERRSGVMVDSVDSLLEKLKHEAKVL